MDGFAIFDPAAVLPVDGCAGTLIGRVWAPAKVPGPAVIAVRADGVFDLSRHFPTVASLLARDEPAAGGALALVREGDRIELDVARCKLHLHVNDAELAKRRAAWKAPEAALTRGCWKLYVEHVNQASDGADLDFLVGKSGSAVPRDNH